MNETGDTPLEFDFSVLDWLVSWCGRHLNQICFAMTATVLAIYGQDINNAVRKKIGHRHFVIRTSVFVTICAFGYGWFILYIGPKIAWCYRLFPQRMLPVAVFVSFVILGIVAERNRKI